MKIITYNVNGIRSAIDKGLIDWLKAANPDVFCIQEAKARPEQINEEPFISLGYTSYWHTAEKKGYSGVTTFSKIKPKNVVLGCGIDKYDAEGRCVRLDFEDCSILNTYFPSGTSGDDRQSFKYEWLDDFYLYAEELQKEIPNLIICGDINICHKEKDIHNPSRNQKSSGFLPEERAWLTKFLASGYIDTFRYFNEEPHHYTWWSYRAAARKKNLGWRIDYFFATQVLEGRLKRCVILPDAIHSDHCPVFLELS